MDQLDFLRDRVSYHLIEISPKMRQLQAENICGQAYDGGITLESKRGGSVSVCWHNHIGLLYTARNRIHVGLRYMTYNYTQVCCSIQHRITYIHVGLAASLSFLSVVYHSFYYLILHESKPLTS